ncbi:MAG: 6-phosphogluconolactonase [Planctomycetes bacterium GWF2_50_10]|nr:MAG: 6-phosphogluconolactonase [Planctomycetes bacterium GWF2_50_10]
MKTRPKIIKSADAEAVAEKAMDIFAAKAQESIKRKGSFIFAISGGKTPLRFFEILGSSPKAAELDWGRTHVFWVDERFVPVDREENNYKGAKELFLDKVDIPPANVHRIKTELPEAGISAADYEKELREVFGLGVGEVPSFDLIVLGMGPDGHTGSLFAGSAAIFETQRLVAPAYFTDERHSRVTLTSHVMKEAKDILIIVTGAEKAPILQQVFDSEPDVITWPIHALWPVMDKITWLVDEDAGGQLPRDIVVEKVESM